MNFPDIDTCRAIAAEFPESEFVWVMRERRKGPWPVIIRRGEIVFGDKILAPAPTREELGVWLRKNKIDYGWQFLGKDTSFFFMGKHITSENETQARAEAVKLILETKWNPSTSTT